MNERTTVRLPADLLKRARRKASDEGRTLTSLLEDGLRQIVDARSQSPKAPRILPRVSSATGGLKPGIDINDSAALQEMDDLDYVRRNF